MKANSIIMVALTRFSLAACGGEKKEGLAGKQEELAKLKSEQSETDQKIKALEAEVAQLDTTAKREDRAKAGDRIARNERKFQALRGSTGYRGCQE